MTLSQDQTELQGKILIHNIAFHKRVSVRYTTDYWQTQTEVAAEYEESIPGSALDRFAFKIPMEMEKTMVERSFCFAVRYQVIGREFWDSNNGMNYQVECKRVVVVAPPAQPSRSQSWSGRDQEASFSSSPTASAPISIPTSKAHGMGSSGYYDLVDRYCFYESSPHTSPYSSYPNSPPAPCIRG
ncbi:putative phosphatase regulatory subunit-domain-containing protein [Linnemannia elongata]|nr:putative phosphatase regulatory subunit-domain-containing protein [Linnemannia elongata]